MGKAVISAIQNHLDELECRAAFLSDATCAISERDSGPEMSQKSAVGLFYWTSDLEKMIHELRELADSD